MNTPERPTGKRKEALLKLAKAPPEKRARLLELEAKKRGLFLPKSEPVVSDMLTPAELERLRQSATAAIAYGRKAFPPKPQATKADPVVGSAMLTPSELEQLRQNGEEAIAFGRKAFPPKTKI